MAVYLSGDVDEWIYIDISDQHPDSIRFIKDCEKALGVTIKVVIGCIKGGMGYWNRILVDFPDVFLQRAKLERELGFSILKDSHGNPVFLDELEKDRGNMNTEIFPDCGIMCYFASLEQTSD